MGPLHEMTRREASLAWFGALGAVGAWIAHFTLGYWWTEGTCNNGNATSSIEPVVIALTVILAGTAILSGVAATITWRSSSKDRSADPRDRIAWMGIAGSVAAVVFTFVIILEGIQVALLDGCAAG